MLFLWTKSHLWLLIPPVAPSVFLLELHVTHSRLGLVPVTESSVIVAVSSEHRRESLNAVSFLIDSLKANIPIWKKEVYNDGSGDWKQNKECIWVRKEDGTSSNIKANEVINNNKRIITDGVKDANVVAFKKIKKAHHPVAQCEKLLEMGQKSSASAADNAAKSAPTCENTSKSAPTCENTSKSAPTCENTSKLAPTCENTSKSAPACENTSKSAPTCENTSKSPPTCENTSKSPPTSENTSKSTPACEDTTKLAPSCENNSKSSLPSSENSSKSSASSSENSSKSLASSSENSSKSSASSSENSSKSSASYSEENSSKSSEENSSEENLTAEESKDEMLRTRTETSPVGIRQSCLLDPNLVQIVASKKELDRRIAAFQQRKREELDVLNVQEFCMLSGGSSSLNSCARTTAVVLRSKGSNSHLKMTHVVNDWGPQTLGLDPGSVSSDFMTSKASLKQECNTGKSSSSREGSVYTGHQSPQDNKDSQEPDILPTGIEERLHNLESHLKLTPSGPVPRDVYARIKAVEDRVLHLEGISPEYFRASKIQALVNTSKQKEIKAVEDDLSLEDLEQKIYQLKMKLKHKQISQVF
ncbi:serine-rich adhesin for platelets isoform X2 [Cherax quadricarinatus]|uniref:serine-rich adhesin for platelets isoform X2 n=1 Tax=Cherax quadricarinatus TaxID=27406 RepID=UPI00387E6561